MGILFQKNYKIINTYCLLAAFPRRNISCLFKKLIDLFVFGCAGSSLLHGLSLVVSGGCCLLWYTAFSLHRLSLVVSGGCSLLWYTGFSLHRLSLVVSGGCSLLWYTGFALRWPLLLCGIGCKRAGCNSCRSQAVECGLCSCGTRAKLPHGIWGLTRSVMKPMSPALAGGFLATGPPGKSCHYLLYP